MSATYDEREEAVPTSDWKLEHGVGTTRVVAAGMEIESGFVLVLGTPEAGMEGLIGPFKTVEAAKKWAVDSEQGLHYVAHMLVPWPVDATEKQGRGDSLCDDSDRSATCSRCGYPRTRTACARCLYVEQEDVLHDERRDAERPVRINLAELRELASEGMTSTFFCRDVLALVEAVEEAQTEAANRKRAGQKITSRLEAALAPFDDAVAAGGGTREGSKT